MGVGWGHPSPPSGHESLQSVPLSESSASKRPWRGTGSQVSLGSFYVGGGYAGALAVEGSRARIPTEATPVPLTLQ
jgi:hypothetical protein